MGKNNQKEIKVAKSEKFLTLNKFKDITKVELFGYIVLAIGCLIGCFLIYEGIERAVANKALNYGSIYIYTGFNIAFGILIISASLLGILYENKKDLLFKSVIGQLALIPLALFIGYTCIVSNVTFLGNSVSGSTFFVVVLSIISILLVAYAYIMYFKNNLSLYRLMALFANCIWLVIFIYQAANGIANNMFSPAQLLLAISSLGYSIVFAFYCKLTTDF